MNNDVELVAACLEGDHRAFARLVDRYRYPVFGLCLGYTRDFDAAEDAAQEAFVAAYVGLPALADPGFFGPWLKRIAINQCRTLWRRAQRRAPLSDAPDEALYDRRPSPEAQMVIAERRSEVMAAVGRLTDGQRQVLLLFYLEEMSLRRIAAFLGISEASAKQRLYRARLSLREEMLGMVKETVGGHALPPDFTEHVVQEAVAHGKALLDARDWQGAQAAFRKVVDALPEHLEANRGLGLALGGEVNGRVRDSVFDDDALAREAFETLTRAFELGATDDAVVRRLVRMYSDFGRNREGGRLLERVAESRTDWREQVRYFKQAIAVYYHSHYRKGKDNKAECVRCHRRIREIAPKDLDVRVKLDLWCPAGMALAYPHVGAADEVFREMDAFEQALDETCSVWDLFYIALIRSNTHRELGQREETAAVSRAFADWAMQLPEGDARLFTPMATIREDDAYEKKRVGEWVRWHVTCVMLSTVARAEHALGCDVAATFARLDRVLETHEAYVQKVRERDDGEAIKMAMNWLAGDYARAGEGAFLSARYARALNYYAREEALIGRLDMHGPVYRVGALAALGRADEAIAQLASVRGRLTATGQWRTTFEEHGAFDAIREHPKVKEIMARWLAAERAGNA